MTEPRRLHLGTRIEDLDKLHTVPDLKAKPAKMLCKTAQKLFAKAEEARAKGDEESSYVYYMKYLRVVAFLSTDKEYTKDKTYFTSMLGLKNPNKAIDAAEKLKKSLIERYSLITQTQKENDREVREEPPEDPIPTPPPPPLGFKLPDEDEVSIRCEQLYPILKSGRVRVMLLDVRPACDFAASHINHHTCVSVPEEVVSPGQSANVLEQCLPAESRGVWGERAMMDLIVLMDWSSTNVIPGKAIYLLKTILLKWDVKVHYPRLPVTLWGGFEDWLLKYPSFTTDPLVMPPGQAQVMDDMLDDIEYPHWGDMAPPAPPPPNTSRLTMRGPMVDRSSKAAAVQIYAERARNLQHILDQQERIADSSLTLEMQRVEAEKNWRRVRTQREGERRDELRAMYQLREQEITSQLMQMENKQFDMEQENQQLREKLEEYQRREREDSDWIAERLADSRDSPEEGEIAVLEQSTAAREKLAVKRARIDATTRQRDKLDRQREVMETERKRKLAEAREKKKPDYDKDEDGDVYMYSPGEQPSATNLKRSESTPSLKEDQAPPPAFDRSTKPIKLPPNVEVYTRDFDPVWGDAKGPGLTGLKNLGNTCYMNSIVQCLNNTALLVPYFRQGKYLKDINRNCSTRGMIADELAAVVRALWTGEYKYISIRDFRRELGKHQRAFRGSDQQDSHEFLTILMDWLHLDLQISIPPPPRVESLPPSERAWFNFTKYRESVILRLFYGQICSTVRCKHCSHKSVTYESFSNISLEMPERAVRCSLIECLVLYASDEVITGWNCPKCMQKRDAIKKLEISRLPPILVIHLKRFYVDPRCDERVAYKKKLTYVDFPLNNLNMHPFAPHNSSPHTKYQLYAVSNHFGAIESGHYTSSCLSYMYNRWYQFDDHQVLDMTPDEVKSSAAYILFYAAV